jgi:hypothetical protein
MATRCTRLAAVVAVSLASVVIAGAASADETTAGKIASGGSDDDGRTSDTPTGNDVAAFATEEIHGADLRGDGSLQVPAPSLAVRPDDDQVMPWGTPWTPGATITLTVDDDADPGNGVLFRDSQPANPWGDWWFDLDGVFDVQRGHFVTVDDGATVKEHQVFDLFLDDVDPESDVVFGRAAPFSDVTVEVVDGKVTTVLVVTSDATGAWTADVGDQEVDISAGTTIYVEQEDEDREQTQIDFYLPEPLATPVSPRSHTTSTNTDAPLTSPDEGDHCANGLGAAQLTQFFSRPIGDFQGADYQRAVRLPDDRVLWTFQDAFVGSSMVHNAALVQSGRCFTRLPLENRSWLLGDRTVPLRRWNWILGAELGRQGSRVHLFVVEMRESGDHYQAAPRPVALRRVVLDARTLKIVDSIELPRTGVDLYGWSIATTPEYSYLYSHCYLQWGYDTLLGSAPCVEYVKVARVPRGRFSAAPEYWNGQRWVGDHRAAVPVVDGNFVVSGNNPAQIKFDGDRFLLVEKRDDWWGETIEFGVSTTAHGPFRHVLSVAEPLKCDPGCNTYFASWVPWREPDGDHIWSIGHNVWDGSTTADNLHIYRPTFHTVIEDYFVPRGWSNITDLDLDGDGRSELFYYNASTGFARFVDPGPSGGGTVIQDYYFRKGWTNITDLDLDGDGRSELFYYNASTGFARFVDPGPSGGGTVIQDYYFRKD